MRRLVLLGATVLGALMLSSTALAQDQNRARLDDGNTLLTLDPDTAITLEDSYVRVSAVGDAAGPTSGGLFNFPVTGGEVRTARIEGEFGVSGGKIRHSGGLEFSRAGGGKVETSREKH